VLQGRHFSIDRPRAYLLSKPERTILVRYFHREGMDGRISPHSLEVGKVNLLGSPSPLMPHKGEIAFSEVLFLVTALAEIIGCYLPYLWLKQNGSIWLLIPAAVSLAVFAWLLTLHPAAAGRVYAAYGGVYVAVAFGWLWAVDGIRPSFWDVSGIGVTLAGMAIIMFVPRHA